MNYLEKLNKHKVYTVINETGDQYYLEYNDKTKEWMIERALDNERFTAVNLLKYDSFVKELKRVIELDYNDDVKDVLI